MEDHTWKLLKAEFELRVFTESFSRLSKCVSLLSNEDLWRSPSSHISPVGCQIKHICGNARQWIFSGLTDKIDSRERSLEFIPEPAIGYDELSQLMIRTEGDIKSVLNQITPIKLDEQLTIQGFKTTPFSAMVHVIEHVSYHTGQVSLLTKWLTNNSLDYYEGLDLNKLN